MKPTFLACALALAALPAFSAGWKLTWHDEFDGDALDASKWNVVTGGNGFGNHELEYYTSRPENLRVRNGMLVIRAVKENYAGPDGVARDYTSARINTKNKFAQRYGRFEARIRIPGGRGMWPAFWLLGDSGRWPDCGEIDIMENIGKEPASVHGTIHGPGYSGAKGITSSFEMPGAQKVSADFHVFAVEWEPEAIRFYMDDRLYKTTTPADLPPGTKWVYDHPFYILLNLAIGGDWPGAPDDSTAFPQTMLVDYVRVYEPAVK